MHGEKTKTGNAMVVMLCIACVVHCVECAQLHGVRYTRNDETSANFCTQSISFLHFPKMLGVYGGVFSRYVCIIYDTVFGVVHVCGCVLLNIAASRNGFGFYTFVQKVKLLNGLRSKR